MASSPGHWPLICLFFALLILTEATSDPIVTWFWPAEGDYRTYSKSDILNASWTSTSADYWNLELQCFTVNGGDVGQNNSLGVVGMTNASHLVNMDIFFGDDYPYECYMYFDQSSKSDRDWCQYFNITKDEHPNPQIWSANGKTSTPSSSGNPSSSSSSAGSSSSPSASTSPNAAPTAAPNNGTGVLPTPVPGPTISVGTVVGIVIAVVGVVVIVALAAFAFFFMRRRRNKRRQEELQHQAQVQVPTAYGPDSSYRSSHMTAGTEPVSTMEKEQQLHAEVEGDRLLMPEAEGDTRHVGELDGSPNPNVRPISDASSRPGGA